MSNPKPLTNLEREEIICKIAASLDVPSGQVRHILDTALPLVYDYCNKGAAKRQWIEPLQ